MGVRGESQGRGVGRALVQAAEAFCRARGIHFLQVKTLGPSHPDEGYAATRRFYERRGFAHLCQLDLWDDPEQPCLIMIKHIETRTTP